MLDMQPLKIGLLTHSVNPRGGVVHTLELANALHEAGHDVTVMAPASPGQQFFRPVRCATRLIAVGAARRDMVAMVGSRIDAITASIGQLLEGSRFDVLHTHDPIGGNALANLVEAGRIEGFVRTVHHLEEFDDTQLMRWQSRGFKAARQVFCVSRLWQSVLADKHGVSAFEVRNGVQRDRFSPLRQTTDATLAQRLGVRIGAPVVLALGGVEARKNTLRLLQAFVLLRARWPDAQLVIAGGASLLDHAPYARDFATLAQASDLLIGPGAPIVLTGPLPDDDIPSLYRLADVVAMPSLNEGFGLVTLEALASGVPIVVSRIAPFTEYLGDADGHWADPMRAASIAEALQAALAARSPAQAAAIADSAARLGATFSWAASAACHVQLYRDGLRGSAAVAPRSVLY